MIEQVEDGPDSYTKTTYHFDEDGRPMETATFDRQGKPTGKSEMKYKIDSFGNWTEQKTWKAGKVQSVVKRVIAYY